MKQAVKLLLTIYILSIGIFVYANNTTFPLFEDFTGGVPPTNWTINNPDNNEGWESTTTTGSDGSQTQVIRMDNYQYNAPGQLDEFILPCIDLTNVTNPRLIFDVAYAPFGASNFEKLRVLCSTDNGATFTTIYDKEHLALMTSGGYQGNGWGPQAVGDWRSDTVNLNAFIGSQIILKFVQTAGYGNGLFIDNINVKTDDPIVANFTNDRTYTCINQTITFRDTSVNKPNAWNWTIMPSTHSFVNNTNANSQHPQINFTTYGTYTIRLITTNGRSTDTTSSQVYIVNNGTYPLFEDFTSGIPPVGWVIANPDNGEGWERTNATGSDGNLTEIIRMDNYQYNAPGQLDEFILPCIDLTNVTNPRLIFDVAYAPFGASNFEKLRVLCSTNNGATFTTIYDKEHLALMTSGGYQGNGWGPQAAGDWRSDTVNLNAFIGSQIILKFVQTAGYGNGLFIDNINVKTDDSIVANFTTDRTYTCINQTVTFRDTSVNKPTAWNWTVTPSTHSFVNSTNANSQHPQVNFTAYGTYTIRLIATNSRSTDTTSSQVYIVNNDTYPLFEDFTSGIPPAGWVIANPDNNEGWERTSATGSDGNLTEIIRMDNYQYNAPGQLDEFILSCIDLSITGVSNPKLTFDVAYAPFGASNFEKLRVLCSTDNGATFTTIYDKEHLALMTSGGYQGNGWGPQSAGDWRSDTVNLSAFVGSKVILRFVQTAGYGNGLFIDNIRMGQATPLPVELLDFSAETIEEGVLLSWETATEINNDYFDVEWSTNGINFEKIGQVGGEGTTLEPQQYQFTDRRDLLRKRLSTHYYRLKQIDFDGKYEYTNVLNIEYQMLNKELRIFPNPAVDIITFENIENIGSIQIFNVHGQLVKEIHEPVSSIQYSVLDLSAGTYFVKIGETTKKLLIQ